MNTFLFAIFVIFAIVFFLLFLFGKFKTSPLWLMLSAWAIALGVPRLNLSDIESPWTEEFFFFP
ncbi:MAG: hypothetical protein KW793_02110, partial [Candidatus Doudnabacteria bacterium]|nr:hypothetical protein [Candidatus Doudnabacteria bacterium]